MDPISLEVSSPFKIITCTATLLPSHGLLLRILYYMDDFRCIQVEIDQYVQHVAKTSKCHGKKSAEKSCSQEEKDQRT